MAGRLFITGDIHGNFDIDKLSHANWPEGRKLKSSDIVAICGDFGLVWTDPSQHREEWWLKWLCERPWTTVFVDGNHENFDVLDAMPVESWHGGDVHVIRRSKGGAPKIVHLMRGQVFDLNGWQTFTFGGAQSHDIEYRLPRVSWWKQEMPTPEEVAAGRARLDAASWKTDLVLTHCAPSRIQSSLDMDYELDRFTDDLQAIADRLDYKLWAFGHYHTDYKLENELCCYYSIWELMREPVPDPDAHCLEFPSGVCLRKSN